MRGTKTYKMRDFWIFEPQGNLIYGFEHTKITSTNKRKYGIIFENSIFANIKFWKTINRKFGPDAEQIGIEN